MRSTPLKFSLYAALSLGLVSPSAAAAEWGFCEVAKRGNRTLALLEQLKLEANGDFVHVASFHGLRQLNTIFGDGGVGGEHMVSSLLYLMQRQLFMETRFLDPALFAIGRGSSPYVKYVQFNLRMHAVDRKDMSAVFKQAGDDAVDALLSYMKMPAGAVGVIIRNPLTRFSPTVEYVFPGQEQTIPPLSAEQVSKHWQKLLKHYGSEDAVRNFLRKSVGTGVAANDIDAKLVARLQIMYRERFNGDVFFNFGMLKFAISEITSAMRRVNWFFANRSSAELQADFIEVRKNIFAKNQWSQNYRNILHRGLRAELADAEVRAAVESMRDQEIKQYVEALGLLDYLPEDRLVLDPQARKAFDNLNNPSHIGLLDIRGLGGMNFNRFHESVGTLRNKMAILLVHLRRVVDMEEGNTDANAIASERAQLERVFGDIMQIRTEVLNASDAFVREVRSSLSKRLLGLGLKPEDIAIWASGDDAFFSIRAPQHSATTVAHALKTDPLIYQWGRVVVFQVENRTTPVPLSEARLMLGTSSDILKFFESTAPNFEIALTGNTTNLSDLKLHTLDNIEQNSLGPAPTALLEYANPFFQTYDVRIR